MGGIAQAQELRVRRAPATLEVLVLYRGVAPGEDPWCGPQQILSLRQFGS